MAFQTSEVLRVLCVTSARVTVAAGGLTGLKQVASAMRAMVTKDKQLNIRVSPRHWNWVNNNARMMEQTAAEYVRSLIEKEGEYITGAEWGRRATKVLGKYRYPDKAAAST